MKLISIFIALFSFSALTNAQPNPRFSVVVVKSLGGSYLYPAAINSTGDVVGGSGTSDGKIRAFVYSQGNMINLGSLGGETSQAFGINDLGHIIGEITGSGVSGRYQPFLYKNGALSDFEGYGINQLGPGAINNSGIVLFINGLLLDTASGVRTNLNSSDGSYLASFQLNNRGDVAAVLVPRIELGGADSGESLLYINRAKQQVESEFLWSGINDAGHYVGAKRSSRDVIANFGDGNIVLAKGDAFTGSPKINNRGHIVWQSIDGIKIYVKGREINVTVLADLRQLYPGFDSQLLFNDADQIVVSNGKDRFLLITPLDDLDRFAPFSVDANTKSGIALLFVALLSLGFVRINRYRRITSTNRS